VVAREQIMAGGGKELAVGDRRIGRLAAAFLV